MYFIKITNFHPEIYNYKLGLNKAIQIEKKNTMIHI